MCRLFEFVPDLHQSVTLERHDVANPFENQHGKPDHDAEFACAAAVAAAKTVQEHI